MFGVIESILRQLEQLGFRAVCAGGCLRDYQWGVTPKDIDIFLMHQGDFSKIAEVFDGEMIIENGVHVESGTPSDYQSDGKHIVTQLIKAEYGGYNIDFIKFDQDSITFGTVVDKFDFRCNTSYLGLNNGRRSIHLVNPYDFSPVHLDQIDEDRFNKMSKKLFDQVSRLKDKATTPC